MTTVRYLGLDVGDRWIGVATGETTGGISSPLRTLRRSTPRADLDAVRRIYASEGGEGIVVGLPYNMDGSLGAQARRTLRFARALRGEGLVVHLCDERLSSAAADDYVMATRGRRPRPGERIDHVAAAIILQDYLNGTGHVDGGVLLEGA